MSISCPVPSVFHCLVGCLKKALSRRGLSLGWCVELLHWRIGRLVIPMAVLCQGRGIDWKKRGTNAIVVGAMVSDNRHEICSSVWL
jgi:hypothetical protein